MFLDAFLIRGWEEESGRRMRRKHLDPSVKQYQVQDEEQQQAVGCVSFCVFRKEGRGAWSGEGRGGAS